MSITKPLLLCAVGLVVIRLVVHLLGSSEENHIWILINQYFALIYFWAIYGTFKGKQR